jgi:hypothetical protein
MALIPILSPELSASLGKLGANLRVKPDRSELMSVLAQIGALPIHTIAKADQAIANAADLRAWREPAKTPFPLNLLSRPLSDFEVLDREPDAAWLYLFHRNGYVREAALRAIVQPPGSPFFLAAIVWRLNDWVEPVRVEARRCAERVFPNLCLEVAGAAAHYLLGRRLAWRRGTHEFDVLDLVLQRPDVIDGMAETFLRSATGSLGTLLRLSLQYPAMERHLPALAADAVQPAVRAAALDCLIKRKASWPVGYTWQWIDKVFNDRKRTPILNERPITLALSKSDLIAQGLRDRSATVRRVGADAAIIDPSAVRDLEVVIERLAQDRSPSLRERADFLRRHPPAAITP